MQLLELSTCSERFRALVTFDEAADEISSVTADLK
jgi:hypothetical protein